MLDIATPPDRRVAGPDEGGIRLLGSMSADNVRHLDGPHELELFAGLATVLDRDLAEELATGRRRPEWMWIATLDGRPAARAAWWAPSSMAVPRLFDIFDIDANLHSSAATEIGERLLRTALAHIAPFASPPDYVRFVPSYWHTDAEERHGVELRGRVLRTLGAVDRGERLTFERRTDATGTGAAPAATRRRVSIDADRPAMARALQRAGYVLVERALSMTWEAG